VETLCAAIAQHADIQMPTIRVGREQRIVNQLKEYLQANFSSNISLEQLVKLTNLNRSYLIPLFRSVVGLPPYVYLTQIRVEKAKQLLVQGESV
jgi:YesN/AraC family two-component response regulator